MSGTDEQVRWTGDRGFSPIGATFEVVEGKTDRHALHEVWTRNDYRLDRFQVAGKTVVDVGANLGGFSTLAVKLGASRVLAYEPHPETFRALLKNLNRNGVDEQVRARNLAVVSDGLEGVPMRLFRDGGAAGLGTKIYDPDEPSADVETVTMTHVLIKAAGQDPLGRIGLMKIDCEGCEYGLFEDLAEGALSNVDRIAMEFHGRAMPHLSYLDDEALGPLLVRLSEEGHFEVRGKASRGGMVFWTNYEAPSLSMSRRRKR